MIFVKIKDVVRNPNLRLFTEKELLIEQKNIELNNEGYMVLSTIQFAPDFENIENLISFDTIKLTKNTLILDKES